MILKYKYLLTAMGGEWGKASGHMMDWSSELPTVKNCVCVCN